VTRILPLLLVVALLVIGGVWLNRERAVAEATPTAAAAPAGGAPEAADALAAEATPAPQAAAAQSEAPAETDAAEPDPATETTPEPDAAPEAEAPADAAAEPAAEPPVPEGYQVVAPLVDERRTSFEAPEQVLDPALDYAAVIETTSGDLVIDLFQDETPVTVNNFVFLALQRYYDGIVFHRVLEDFMAQTGDPTGTGSGGPGYQFADEIVEGLSHDQRGVVSMANAGPGTNGSQFFITFTATPWLDGNHTVFGRVIAGDEVLDRLRRIDPASQNPVAAAALDAPASALREQGVALEGEGTVQEALEATLGAMPVTGQSFEVAGFRGVIGSLQGTPAAGFFPFPDVMERVTIVTRPR
jgi:cyclophilin family peptidyl-prolyl cis-trans isomerase